jgi:hypothetical protein
MATRRHRRVVLVVYDPDEYGQADEADREAWREREGRR